MLIGKDGWRTKVRTTIPFKESYYLQNPDDEDSIQWVVDIIEDYHRPMREGFNLDNKFSDLGDSKVDRDIMVCPDCNLCWENGKVPGDRAYYIYSEFPKIGKTNYKVCPECSDWLFSR